jgi:hypothetical protein
MPNPAISGRLENPLDFFTGVPSYPSLTYLDQSRGDRPRI